MNDMFINELLISIAHLNEILSEQVKEIDKYIYPKVYFNNTDRLKYDRQLTPGVK
jgi:hypothetical protein